MGAAPPAHGDRSDEGQGIPMTELMLNRMAERIMVFGGGCVIVGGMAAVDETVRNRVTSVLTGGGISELSVAGASLHHTLLSTFDTIGYHGSTHAPLTFFAVAA